MSNNHQEIEQLRSSNSRLESALQELKLEISYYKGETKRLEWEKDVLHHDVKRMSSLVKSWVDEMRNQQQQHQMLANTSSTSTGTIVRTAVPARLTSTSVNDELPVVPPQVKNPCKSICDLLQLNNNVIFVTSCQPPHYIEYVNKTWSEECGWQSSEVLGYTCSFLQGELTNRSTTEGFMKDLQTLGYAHMRVFNYRKNHQVFEVDVTVYPVFDSICPVGPDSEVAVLTHFASVMTNIDEPEEDPHADSSTSSAGVNNAVNAAMNVVNGHQHHMSAMISTSSSSLKDTNSRGQTNSNTNSTNSDTQSGDGHDRGSNSRGSSGGESSSNHSDSPAHHHGHSHTHGHRNSSNSNGNNISNNNNKHDSNRSSSDSGYDEDDEGGSSEDNNHNKNNKKNSSINKRSSDRQHNHNNRTRVHSSSSMSEETTTSPNAQEQEEQQEQQVQQMQEQQRVEREESNNSPPNTDNGSHSSSMSQSRSNNEDNNSEEQEQASGSSAPPLSYDRRVQSRHFDANYVVSSDNFLRFGETLRLSNLLRLMLSTTDAMLLTDALGRVIHVNVAWVRLTGYELVDVEGQTCAFLQGPESDSAIIGDCRNHLIQQKAYEMKIVNYKKVKPSSGESSSSSDDESSEQQGQQAQHGGRQKFLNHVIIVPIKGGYLEANVSHFCSLIRQIHDPMYRQEGMMINGTRRTVMIGDANNKYQNHQHQQQNSNNHASAPRGNNSTGSSSSHQQQQHSQHAYSAANGHSSTSPRHQWNATHPVQQQAQAQAQQPAASSQQQQTQPEQKRRRMS